MGAAFDTAEELRQALLDFKQRYNRYWLLQRHRWRTPEQVRATHCELLSVAA